MNIDINETSFNNHFPYKKMIRQLAYNEFSDLPGRMVCDN